MRDSLPVLQSAQAPPFNVVPYRGDGTMPVLASGETVHEACVMTVHRAEVSTSGKEPIKYRGHPQHATARSNGRATLLSACRELSQHLNAVRAEGKEVASSIGIDGDHLYRVLQLVRPQMAARQEPGEDAYNPADFGEDEPEQAEGSEEVNQLVQAIVDKCKARQQRRSDDTKSRLGRNLELASHSVTPHYSVMSVLAEHSDLCTHGIQVYFEILARGDPTAIAIDSRQAAAERIWVFVTCAESAVHRIGLDDALDRIIARNNAPPAGKFSRPTVPTAVCSFTSTLRVLHPDLTERLFLAYHERRQGVAQRVLQAITELAFVDKRGKALCQLTDSTLRPRDIGLKHLFGLDDIGREPVTGNQCQYLQQLSPFTYLGQMHPEIFPPDYADSCNALEAEQIRKITHIKRAIVTLRKKQDRIHCELEAVVVIDEEEQLRQQLDATNQEIQRMDTLMRDAHNPLRELHASCWKKLDPKWYSKGISIRALPLLAQNDCFWQVADLAGMQPPLYYSSFIGHWEGIQQLRCRRPEASSLFLSDATGGIAVALTDDASMIPFDQMPGILQKPSYSTRLVNDFMHTTLHQFTDEHMPTLVAWCVKRDKVLAGKALPESMVSWSVRLRQIASDLINNVARQTETDSIFRETVCAGASNDEKLHLFGEARLRPENECGCLQDPSVETGDEAVQYIMSTAGAGLNLGFTHLPFLLLWLVTLDSCISRNERMKTHVIFSGKYDAGKSHLLNLINKVSLPGLHVKGGKESACAGFADCRDDGGMVGVMAFHEAPMAIKNYKAGKDGSKECDERDEDFKIRMSEGCVTRKTAGLGTGPNGHTETIVTETRKFARHVLCMMTNDPKWKLSNEVLSRGIFWAIDHITGLLTSPANFKVSENAEGGVGIEGSEAHNKAVYVQFFTEFTQRIQLLALMHGGMRIFAPGVIAPHTAAMNHVYCAFERVLVDMGSQKRPTRAVTQAMSIAETLMQLRVYYEDSRRHGALGAGTIGTRIENYYSKRRTSELRQVLSVGDCIKAVGLVLADDKIHDVLRVLDAIIGLVEAGKYSFSDMFTEPGVGHNAPRTFTPDCLRFTRFSKHVQSGDNVLFSFANLLAPHASGMNPDRILSTLRELERSHALSDYSHRLLDMNMGNENGMVWTALDAEEARHSDVQMCDKMLSTDNFDRRGNTWQQLRKNSEVAPRDLLVFWPYQERPRPDSKQLTTPFVSVDSYRGEVRIASAAIVDRMNGKLNKNSGVLKKMCDYLSDSTTTSRFTGFTPSGMSALDPAAPQLLELTYLRHNPERHAVSLNPQFVSNSMHNWMAPGKDKPGVCAAITGDLLPDIPLDLQFALQHILRASEVDPNVYPGAHQVFDSDPLGFLVMAPFWAREIVDKIGSLQAEHLWRPNSPSAPRREVIRAHLGAAPSEGGYLDWMRHYDPVNDQVLDPDHEMHADGENESKDCYLRFLEKTTANLERIMSLPDEATLPEASIPQTDAAEALRRDIQAVREAGGPSMPLKLQALTAQLAVVKVERERLMQNIRIGRHSPVVAPAPFAWLLTREKLDDRPGVHSGAGYCNFVRNWAKERVRARTTRWGALAV
jgi:hypothetical protein